MRKKSESLPDRRNRIYLRWVSILTIGESRKLQRDLDRVCSHAALDEIEKQLRKAKAKAAQSA